MTPGDTVQLALESMRLHRLRTGLTVAGIAIGVTAVLLLTSLGDAAKRYVVREFAGMGTNLVVAMPGRTETSGFGSAIGGTTRDLTLEDAEAVRRQAPAVRETAPMSLGSATFAYGGRSRDVYVIGTTAAYASVRSLRLSGGEFLPPGDPRLGAGVVVIGRTIQREVFRDESPLGKPVRIGTWRLRVIGVLAPKGQSLGFDYDDLAIVPVATGLKLFDQTSLFRVVIEARDAESVGQAVAETREVLRRRHDGAEDFTLITQDAMLKTFRSIINALTVALAGIAAISLGVAGIGIMNVMLVSVSERTAEVGLFKAIGAKRAQILGVFLAEAFLLSLLGAVAGILVGAAVTFAAAGLWPALPLRPSAPWIGAVLLLALGAGGVFGLLPARRASRLDAAEALRASK
ncbi:MAG TPA: ABC transporter permease [Candidatus Eisenbacteria bacterium]